MLAGVVGHALPTSLLRGVESTGRGGSQVFVVGPAEDRALGRITRSSHGRSRKRTTERRRRGRRHKKGERRGRALRRAGKGVLKKVRPPHSFAASAASLSHGTLGQGAVQTRARSSGSERVDDGGASTKEVPPGVALQKDSSGLPGRNRTPRGGQSHAYADGRAPVDPTSTLISSCSPCL